MIRLIVIAAFVAASATAAVWLAERPGHIVIDWQEYRIETSAALVAVVIIGLVVVALWLYRLWVVVIQIPGHLRQKWDKRQHQKGLTALARGLTAVAAGDLSEIDQQARRAGRLLHQPGLALWLSAQAARLKGDEAAARTYYASLTQHPESRFLGLQGLAGIAERQGDWPSVRRALEQASHIKPKASWVVEGLVKLAAYDGDWPRLIDLLQRARRTHSLPADLINRRLMTAWLAQSEDVHKKGDITSALTAARKARRRDPNNVAATVAIADLLIEQGSTRQAKTLITKAWKIQPHRLLAAAYRRLNRDDDPLTRAQKTDRLAALAPNDPESHRAQAQAAFEADLWGKARDHLARATPKGPTRETCLIMAEIERREHGNDDAARQWQRRAGVTPPDAAWICSNCTTRWDEWSPLCEACGHFASLDWCESGLIDSRRLAPSDPPVTAFNQPDGESPRTTTSPQTDGRDLPNQPVDSKTG